MYLFLSIFSAFFVCSTSPCYSSECWLWYQSVDS